MIKGAGLLALAFWAASPSAAATELPDNPLVDATLSALKAGDTAELNWLVTHVGNVQFPRQAFFERGRVFALLEGCDVEERERLAWRNSVLYRFEWDCGELSYVGRLAPSADGQTVAFVDFFGEPEFSANLERLPRIMAPPVPIGPRPRTGPDYWSEERKAAEAVRMTRKTELAGVFAKAFSLGDFSKLENRFSTYQKIHFGFLDSVGDKFFVDKVWRINRDLSEGAPKLTEASQYVQAQLGKPVSASCEPSGVHVECRWQFAEETTSLKARIHVFREDAPNWGFKIFEIQYQTAELLADAKRRAS